MVSVLLYFLQSHKFIAYLDIKKDTIFNLDNQHLNSEFSPILFVHIYETCRVELQEFSL